jgi:hypothetical protein
MRFSISSKPNSNNTGEPLPQSKFVIPAKAGISVFSRTASE